MLKRDGRQASSVRYIKITISQILQLVNVFVFHNYGTNTNTHTSTAESKKQNRTSGPKGINYSETIQTQLSDEPELGLTTVSGELLLEKTTPAGFTTKILEREYLKKMS